jgi:hypothetical protein
VVVVVTARSDIDRRPRAVERIEPAFVLASSALPEGHWSMKRLVLQLMAKLDEPATLRGGA